MITSPPRPPSPPEGPPRGTNFSRRKAMQPLPPPPAITRIFASSINISSHGKTKGLADARGLLFSLTETEIELCVLVLCGLNLRLGNRLHHHELPHGALIYKLQLAADLRKQRVVLAPADVQARLHPSAALPHDDRATGHNLSSKSFKPEPLRIGIAAVS